MSFPSVLFVSSCDFNPEDLIQKVLDKALPAPLVVDDNISAYPWEIDNKYYTCTVSLCGVKGKSIGSPEFANSVDGVVIAFDASIASGLESVASWLPFVTCYDADIKLLVCTACAEEDASGVSKRTAQEWCVENKFELIELEPTGEVDPEDDFPETTGVARIRQALHAHEWSNLVLKGEQSRVSVEPTEGEDFPGGLAESLEEMLDNDSFGDLFSQLADMKERVGRLSGQARQDAAEQVVRAFWNAMGGDDAEL